MKKIETNKAYHNTTEYISCSGLKEYLKSPAHYQAFLKEQPESKALTFGSYYHLLVLEPEKIKKEFATDGQRPDQTKGMTAKVNKEWKDSLTIEYISEEDVQIAEDMKNQLEKNPNLKNLIGKGINEESYYLDDFEGVKVRCRPDKVTDNAIIDLKTCSDASTEGFLKQIFKYGYHIQAAFYSDILKQIDGKDRQFVFIAQEKKAPYAFQVFRVDHTILLQGRSEYKELLKVHKHCIETNTWGGYETYSESEYGVVELSIPAWAIRDINLVK